MPFVEVGALPFGLFGKVPKSVSFSGNEVFSYPDLLF
jgi:hypothetical protein